MNQKSKGFVVSAVLYPLLILFLALIMGLLAMTDTRKRILDKMKLEISDSIFDEATCSCDTILNKLNYLIKNGVSGGGGGGSYAYNVLGLNVKTYEEPSSMPNIGNSIGDIAVISTTEMPENNYYVSTTPPGSPKEGTIWIVQDINSPYYIQSDYSKIGISYVMQYESDTWTLKKSYVYQNGKWELLYYVPIKDGKVDITDTEFSKNYKWNYNYKGTVQEFVAPYTGYYKIEAWGAQGGTRTNVGGLGAYTKGVIYLRVGDLLYLYVGGSAVDSTGNWNGGGSGWSSGGGATDIRLVKGKTDTDWSDFDSLKSRIMVAAGGGGGAVQTKGGAGGGLSGYDMTGRGTALGGKQSLGGNGAISNVTGKNGSFGTGGNGVSGYGGYSGGGGGGYYGGGGGGVDGSSDDDGGGAGGSSYISGHNGCETISERSTSIKIIPSGDPYHYSGFYFEDTVMIDGNGYEWLTEKGNLTQMLNYNGNMVVGNSGQGHINITLQSVEIKTEEEINENKYKINTLWNYTFTGNVQEFVAPVNGNYKIETWGAKGATRTNVGGNGGYSKGEIFLQKGSRLYVYIGGTPTNWTGNYNGGGSGWGNGGGATDIRLVEGVTWNEFDSLKSRIMVAGGGGGGAVQTQGGAGGGLLGYNMAGRGTAYGGTQIAGGNGAVSSVNGKNGLLGIGGNGVSGYSGYSGGGGGGYYGGGGGGVDGSSDDDGGGAGGSSYISGHAGCIGLTSEGKPKVTSYSNISDSVSYTGYKFINTQMIDGLGYSWTTVKGNTVISMPSPTSSSLITGNTGSGYARITYLGA